MAIRKILLVDDSKTELHHMASLLTRRGFAVRTALGLAPVPGSVGLYYWGGIAGTTFFVDPALDLYAMLLIQAPNQRDHYRPLFRDMVYAALL